VACYICGSIKELDKLAEHQKPENCPTEQKKLSDEFPTNVFFISRNCDINNYVAPA
jgi:hypothetical protein